VDNIIKTDDLHFHYENEEGNMPVVIDGISLEIQKGQFVAVLGHNGSGKSTLAKHFNAILLPTSGKVYVHGIDTCDDEKVFEIRQNVGMVFQNPDNQIVATIVEEDVAFALENLSIKPEEIRKRVDDALKTVGMYEYREHAPHQLSGGQKQRIAIAGIIAMRPDCIVLDEPTAMLDPKGRKEVLKTIRNLNKEYGITTVLITHYMDEAAKADRVVVMDNGKVILDDVPRKVFWNVELMRKIGLDVPQSAELVYELIEDGHKLEKFILTDDECVSQLDKLLTEKGVKKTSVNN
jgi:energy-coupling factor transport system ATP-binding protein